MTFFQHKHKRVIAIRTPPTYWARVEPNTWTLEQWNAIEDIVRADGYEWESVSDRDKKHGLMIAFRKGNG